MISDDFLPRVVLRDLFDQAIAAAAPARVIDHLPRKAAGLLLVIGAGKAAAAMAAEAEAHLPSTPTGLAITRHGHGVPCQRVEVIEAAHPVPDSVGLAAARRALDAASALGPDDLLLCLLSGGASALLALPADGVGLAEKQAVTRALLASGAPIGAINTVRKHLSAIKGGRLAAAAYPAATLTLAISDVPGDDPAVIGSGPTVPDPSTAADARAILTRYGVAVSPAIRAHLDRADCESPKPGDPRLARAAYRIIARPREALDAASARARAHGLDVHDLGDRIEGEAAEVAEQHAALIQRIRRGDGPVAPPCVIMSGGETSVTLRKPGRGGRNTTYLLALALALKGAPGIHAIACDTDGIDGTEANAGALIGPDSWSRAQALGLDLAAMLEAHDSFGAFAALGDLVTTGPTRTNVNDFRAILVLG